MVHNRQFPHQEIRNSHQDRFSRHFYRIIFALLGVICQIGLVHPNFCLITLRKLLNTRKKTFDSGIFHPARGCFAATLLTTDRRGSIPRIEPRIHEKQSTAEEGCPRIAIPQDYSLSPIII